MFKDTCLVALKRKDWSSHIIDLEILVCMLLKSSYFGLEIFVRMVLKVFLYLILKSSYVGFKTNSPNAQAYNHTNALIISIGIV
jgi:hypothetical protein